MGNAQSNVNGGATEVIHISSRPLPPLPNAVDGEYDSDAPPAYPPPPPPTDDVPAKRLSWKLIDGNLFKNRKSGSWIVPGEHQYDSVSANPIPETHISDTLALDSSDIVTFRYLDNDDGSNVSHDKSWGPRNMQMVMNSEVDGSQNSHHPRGNGTHSRNGFSKRMNSPNGNGVHESKDIYLVPNQSSNGSYAYHSTPKQGNGNNVPKLNTIRLDYPEGTARTITNYNEFDNSKYSVDASSIGSTGTSSMTEDDEYRSNISNDSMESIESPKKRSFNLGPCFGESKSKKARIDQTTNDKSQNDKTSTIEGTPIKTSVKASPKSKNRVKKYAKRNNGTPPSQKVKSPKKPDFSACFGKSKQSMGSTNSIDNPEITNEDNIELNVIGINGTKVNMADSDTTLVVNDSQSITDGLPNLNGSHAGGVNGTELRMQPNSPKVEANISVESSNNKVEILKPKRTQNKLDLGSCFGKGKSPKGNLNSDIIVPSVSSDDKYVPVVDCKNISSSLTVETNDDQNIVKEISPSLDIPKINIGLEGNSSSDIYRKTHRRQASLDIPTVEIKAISNAPFPQDEINLASKFDVIPDVECDLSIRTEESSDINADITPLNIDMPKLDASIQSPSMCIPEDIINCSTTIPQGADTNLNNAEVSSDISVELPNASINTPKMTTMKEKSSGLSCFGKSKPSKEAYKPSSRLEVDVNAPKVELSSNISDLHAENEIVPIEKKTNVKKPKSNLASCFGKNIKKDETTISTKLPIRSGEINMDVDSTLPEASIEIDSSLPEVDVEVSQKPSVNIHADKSLSSLQLDEVSSPPQTEVKAKGPKLKVNKETPKLGSCFRTKKNINTDIKSDSDMDVNISADLPKSNIGDSEMDAPKVNKKKKLEFGSCFGKKSMPKGSIEHKSELSSVDLEGNASVPVVYSAITKPSLNVETNIDRDIIEVKTDQTDHSATPKLNVELVGSSSKQLDIEFPTVDSSLSVPNIDVHSNGPSSEDDLNISTNMFSIPKIQGDLSLQGAEPVTIGEKLISTVETPTLKSSIEYPNVSVSGVDDMNPKISSEISGIEFSKEVNVNTPDIKNKTVKLKPQKRKSLSCFGKAKANKNTPSVSDKLAIDVNTPEVEVQSTITDIDGEKEIKIQKEGHKVKKPGTNLGSCFGKTEKTKKVEISSSLPIRTNDAGIDVDSSLARNEIEIETTLPDIKVKQVKKSSNKKATLGSCFGNKKSADIVTAEASLPTPEIDICPKSIAVTEKRHKKNNKMIGSCFKSKQNMDKDICVDADINLDVKSPQSDKESVPTSKSKTSKKKLALGSCFGKGKVGTKLNSDVPSINLEVSPSIPSASTKIIAPVIHIEENIETDTIEISPPCISVPKLSIELEGNSPSIDTVDLPVYDGSSDVPNVEIKGTSNEVILPTDVNISTESVDLPKIEYDLSLNSAKESVTMDTDINPINVNVSPVISSIEGHSDIIPDIDLNFPKLTLETPDTEASSDVMLTAPNIGVNAPNVNNRKRKGSGMSCFGNSKVKEDAYDVPAKLEVETKAPILRIDAKIPDEKFSHSKRKQKNRGTNLASCFGKTPKTEDLKIQSSLPPPSGEACIHTEVDLGDTAIKVEPSLPEAKIKVSKDISGKKVPFGSCFGSKKQMDTKTDMPTVESDISSPAIGIEKETPKIKNSKSTPVLMSCFGRNKKPDTIIEVEESGKIEFDNSDEIAQPNIKGSIELPTINKGIDEPKQNKKRLGLGPCFGKKKTPKNKCDIAIECPSTDLEVNSTIADAYITPTLSMQEKIEDDIEVTVPNISTPKISLELKGDDCQLPEFDSMTSNSALDLPTVSVPELSSELNVGSSGDGISVDPDININKPKIKVRKQKGNSLSCFGNSKTKEKARKSSAEIVVDIDAPQVDFDSNVPDTCVKKDVKISEGKFTAKKSRPNFKSCFGKAESKEQIKVSTSLPISNEDVNTDEVLTLPEAEIVMESSLPKVDVNVSKKSPTKKISLGSCFGNNKPMDKTVDQGLPTVEVDSSVNSIEVKGHGNKNKGAPKLGSCFGNKKKSDTEVDIKTSDDAEINIIGETSHPTVEGSLQIPTVSEDTVVSKPNKTKLNIGSCFGKGKVKNGIVHSSSKLPSASLEVSSDIPSISGEINAPVVNVEDNSQQVISEIITPNITIPKLNVEVEGNDSQNIDVKIPKSNLKKRKEKSSGLSCFGNSESKKNKFGSSAKLETDVNLPSVEIDSSIPDINIEKDVKIQGNGNKVKKPETNFLSCLGKTAKEEKITVSASLPTCEISKDENIIVPEEGIQIESTLPETEVKLPNKISNKNKLSLVSCFGNKHQAESTGEGAICIDNINEPSKDYLTKDNDQSVKVKKSGIKLSSCFSNKKGQDNDTNVKVPSSTHGQICSELLASDIEGSIQIPSASGDLKVKKSNKKRLQLGSCFGKRNEIKDSNTAIPEANFEVQSTIPSISNEISVPNFNADCSVDSDIVKVDMPTTTRKLSINLEGATELDVDLPNVVVDGVDNASNIGYDLNFPSDGVVKSKIDTDFSLDGIVEGASFDTEINPVSVDVPSIPTMSISPTVQMPQADINIPEILLEIPDVETSNEIKVSSSNIIIDKPKLKSGKTKGSGLSCFGNSKRKKNQPAKLEVDTISKTDIKSTIPELCTEKNISTPNVKVKKSRANINSCFGKPAKAKDMKVSSSMPIPVGEANINTESSLPESSIKMESDDKVDIPKSSAKNKAFLGSCFGGKKSVNLVIDKSIPSVEEDDSLKNTEVEKKKSKLEAKKGGAILGSCFGSKKRTVNQPHIEASCDADIKLDTALSPNIEALSETPATGKGTDKQNNRKMNILSCFGKGKQPNEEPEFPSDSLALDSSINCGSNEISIPALKIESNVEHDTIEVVAPHIEDPKLDIELEGNSSATGGVQLPQVDYSLQLPNVNIEGSSDTSVIEKDINISTDGNVLPKLEYDLSLNTDVKPVTIDTEITPVRIDIPVISTTNERLTATSPQIDVNLPDISNEVEIADLKQQKRGKGKDSYISCFGKSKNKKDSYQPNEKLQVAVNTPEIDIERHDIGAEKDKKSAHLMNKSKKSSTNLSSCFGKPAKTEKVTISTPATAVLTDESTIRVDSPFPEPSIKLEASIPKGDIHISKSSQAKSKTSLSQCFGKKKSTSIHNEVSLLDVDTNISPKHTEGSTRSLTVKENKSATKLGSCFGKNKKVKSDIDIKADMAKDVTYMVPQQNLESSEGVPTVSQNVELSKKNKGNNMKLGSCFGKKQASNKKLDKSIELSSEPINISSDIDIDKGTIEPDLNIKGDIEQNVLEVSAPDIPKINLNFENNSSQEIDLDLREIDGVLAASKIELEGNSMIPVLDGNITSSSSDLNNLQKLDYDLSLQSAGPSNIDAEIKPLVIVIPSLDPSIQCPMVSDMKTDMQVNKEVKASKITSHKKKGSLGSCFGSKKSVNLATEGKVPTVKTDVPCMDIEVKTENPKGKTKNAEMKLGSCFGNKKKSKTSANVGLSGDVGINTNPEILTPHLGGTVTTCGDAHNIDSPKNNHKKKIELGGCFGKRKIPREKSNSPPELPSASFGISSANNEITVSELPVECNIKDDKIEVTPPNGMALELEGNSFSNLVVQSPDIPESLTLEKIEFDKNLDASTLLGDVKLSTDIEFSPKSDPALFMYNSESTSVAEINPIDINIPIVSTDLERSTFPIPEVDQGISNDFGEISKSELSTEVTTNLPNVKSEIKFPDIHVEDNIKSPEIEIKCEVPDISAEADIKLPKGKSKLNKPVINLGSCFGKKGKANNIPIDDSLSIKAVDKTMDSALPEGMVKIDSSLPTDKKNMSFKPAEAKVKVIKEKSNKSAHKLGSCFGKEKKSKNTVATSGDGCVVLNAELPNIDREDSIEVPTEIDVSIQHKKSKFEFVSPFNKGKASKGKLDSIKELPSISLETDSDIPCVINDISLSAENADYNTKQDSIDVVIPHIDTPKLTIKSELSNSTEHSIDLHKFDITPTEKQELSLLDVGNLTTSAETDQLNVEIPAINTSFECQTASVPELDVSCSNVSTDMETSTEVVATTADTISFKQKVKNDNTKFSGLSCFGNSKPKKNTYVQSEKLEVSHSTSRVEGKPSIDLVPEVYINDSSKQISDARSSGDNLVVTTDTSITAPSYKLQKEKGSPFSCFGNSKTTKETPYVSTAEINVDTHIPDVDVQSEASNINIANGMHEHRVNHKAKKPRVKLGSCFGKPVKEETPDPYLNMNVNTELDVTNSANVAIENPISINSNMSLPLKDDDRDVITSVQNIEQNNSELPLYDINIANSEVNLQESITFNDIQFMQTESSTEGVNTAILSTNGIESNGCVSLYSNNINLPDVIEANIPRLTASELDIGDGGVFDGKVSAESKDDESMHNSYQESNFGKNSPVKEKPKYFSAPSISDSISDEIAETIENFQRLKDGLMQGKQTLDPSQDTISPDLPTRWYNIDSQQDLLSEASIDTEVAIPSHQISTDTCQSQMNQNSIISSHYSKDTMPQEQAGVPLALSSTSPFVTSLSEEILKEFINEKYSEMDKVVHQLSGEEAVDPSSNYSRLEITATEPTSGSTTHPEDGGFRGDESKTISEGS